MFANSLKPLSDIHEFVHDMRRVSTSTCNNSPRIDTNVHELSPEFWSKLFYEFHTTCPIYSWRNISRFFRSSTSLYDTCTTFTICVREPHDIPATFLRVLASLQELRTITREPLRFNTIYYDMLRHLLEISTSTYESSSTFDFYTTSDVFWNLKKEYA